MNEEQISVAEVFDVHVAKRLSGCPRPLPSKKLLFVILGEHGGIWTVDFGSRSVSRGERGVPDLTIRLEEGDFHALIEGEISGKDLFDQKLIEFNGDLHCAELLEVILVESDDEDS